MKAPTKRRVGRPVSQDPKDFVVWVRLDKAHRSAFEALLAAKNAELAPLGGEMKIPDLVRWLIRVEAERRGMWPPPGMG